jgi:membrane protein DedA with SNARE-associated domain
VSFFAGVSELDFRITTSLSFVSSLVWQAILVYAGYSLGAHWESVGQYLRTYTVAITVITIVVIVIAGGRFAFMKWKVKRRG